MGFPESEPRSRSTGTSGSLDVVSPERKTSLLTRTAQWLFVILASGFLLRTTAGFTVPLAFAVFLAVLFAPVADALERRRVPGPIATTISTLAVLGIIVLFGIIVGRSAASVASKSSVYAVRASQLFGRVSDWAAAYLEVDLAAAISGQELSLPPLLERAIQPLTDVAQLVVGILLTLIFFVFLLHFRRTMRNRLFEIFVEGSPRARERELMVIGAGTTVRRYLWIKFSMSVATALAIGIASLVLGLDFPLVWGVLAFGLNFIPSLGPLLAMLPAAGIGVVQVGPGFGLLVAAVMASLHFLSGNVIEPIVLGYRLKLNFLVILLSLFVWALVWGFAGMVLAVPITACIKLALDYSGRRTALGIVLAAASEEEPRPPPR